MLIKLVLGLLATCLLAQAWTEPDIKYGQRETITLCKNNGDSPCTCYADGPKLDCRSQLGRWDIDSRKWPEFSTPSEKFYPRTLDLSNNEMDYFNASLFLTKEQRRTVEVLNLSGNNLGNCDHIGLDGFDNLRVLNLSSNSLSLYDSTAYYNWRYRSQPDTESYLTLFRNILETVEVLDLSDNQISDFPNKLLSKFKKLKRVILDNNRLSNYGFKGYYQALTVEELSMNNCSLNYVSDEIFRSVPNVKKLWMRHNDLTSLPNMRQLDKITLLDLSWNDIHYLSNSHAYGYYAYSLQTLLLSHNPLYRIESNSFERYNQLTKLDLSYTDRLYTIDPNAFGVRYSYDKSDCKLRELNLEGSLIGKLSKDMLDWSKLTSLKIKDTELVCDTDLSWLILDKSIPIESDVTCRSPAALRGRKLRDVKKEELQSPIETSILYYLKQALDWLTQDQPLFYFGLGALAACVLMLALRCCYCCLCCCVRRTDRKIMKLKEEHDRRKLLQTSYPKPPEEDTQTIVSTIPDE